jgi:hypothetical protein
MSDKVFDIIIRQEKRQQKRTAIAANESEALWAFWEASVAATGQLPVIYGIIPVKLPKPPNQGNTEKW